MINDLKPDLNIILTPSAVIILQKFHLNKCHTITEKPISMTPKQARKLINFKK